MKLCKYLTEKIEGVKNAYCLGKEEGVLRLENDFLFNNMLYMPDYLDFRHAYDEYAKNELDAKSCSFRAGQMSLLERIAYKYAKAKTLL